jgi:hypothetical protein
MDQTALERAQIVVPGDGAELRLEGGRVTISKQTITREAPTTVDVDVDQVRGAQLRTSSRGSRGWLHIAVVGGSPAPPGELAAAGDPYALPLTPASLGPARRLVKLVERHIRERGMPSDAGLNEGRSSSGVALTDAPVTVGVSDGAPGRSGVPEVPSEDGARAPADPAEFVAELRTLAELHTSGALSDDEFERAKARVLS